MQDPSRRLPYPPPSSSPIRPSTTFHGVVLNLTNPPLRLRQVSSLMPIPLSRLHQELMEDCHRPQRYTDPGRSSLSSRKDGSKEAAYHITMRTSLILRDANASRLWIFRRLQLWAQLGQKRLRNCCEKMENRTGLPIILRYFLCFLFIFSSSPDKLEVLRDQYSPVTKKSIRLVSFVLTLPKYSSLSRSHG
jgi:hypothetical protein